MALKSKHSKEVASPDQFLTRSMVAVSWLEKNRALAFGGVAVVVLLGVAYVGVGNLSEERHASVTRKVTAVLEAEGADVVAEPPPVAEGEDEENRPMTFRTEKQRSETLVRRYKKLLAANGSDEVTAFAHLGLGGVYADLGKQTEATKEYQAVLDSGVDSLAPFAVEGLAYVLEARGKRREALAKLDELKTMQDGKFRNLATYHIARMEIADGRKAQALELLQRLQRDLAESPELVFLRDQTVALIGQLESEGIMATRPAASDEGGAAKKKGGGARRGSRDEGGDNE